MSTVTIEMPDGETIELDADLLREYREESFGYLKKEAEAKAEFKDAIEAQAETLGIDKKFLAKYIKASYKAKTNEAKALGELFTALDDATDEKLEIFREDD